jgi:hypothetical protein
MGEFVFVVEGEFEVDPRESLPCKAVRAMRKIARGFRTASGDSCTGDPEVEDLKRVSEWFVSM